MLKVHNITFSQRTDSLLAVTLVRFRVGKTDRENVMLFRANLKCVIPLFQLRRFRRKSQHNDGRLGSRSRYSDLLRDGQSGVRIPVEAGIFPTHPDRPRVPPSRLYNRCQVSFPAVNSPQRGVDQPPASSAEVKERVELHLYPHLGLHGLL